MAGGLAESLALSATQVALALALALLALPVGGARAGDAAAGRKRAVACQTCHGLDGVSKMPDAPNLSGQVEEYLASSLTAFRSGARANETMNLVAKDLSDTDIDNLAAYYGGIQIAVIPPD